MSVAAASLLVAVGLTALACANWLWLRADSGANPTHLQALADVALAALAVHALALIVTATTSLPAYGLTVVLACAAAAVRDGRVRRSPPPEGRFVAHPPEPAPTPRPRTTLWSK
jgi:hypothetical protein